MTGTTESKDPPRTDAEWARDVSRRQDLAEHPDSVRCGAWVLWTDDDGNLVGSYRDGGSRVIAPRPPSGVDPESVTESALPSITAVRSGLQTIPGTGGPVIFDGITSRVGDWRTSGGLIPAVVVPETGPYTIMATVWFELGGAYLMTAVTVEGLTRIGGRLYEGAGAAWIPVTSGDQIYLTAGQSVALTAVAAGAARNVGAAPVFSTAIPTSLSLSMISRG
ncbi:hypothetical protein ACPESR_25300 [Nocardia testacea]|uniref:hypothetical protein n=1 Tax=Nocardia testacea TaxID=248551 RepID=UPI003C2E5B16